MGCLCSKEDNEDAKETEEKPVYSWYELFFTEQLEASSMRTGGGCLKFPCSFSFPRDKRERVNPKDYTIGDVQGETFVRRPGTVNGQQFIIQNCQVISALL